jgi:hypothetical protein
MADFPSLDDAVHGDSEGMQSTAEPDYLSEALNHLKEGEWVQHRLLTVCGDRGLWAGGMLGLRPWWEAVVGRLLAGG